MPLQEMKLQALQAAVGHRLSHETPKMVVENAEKYFAFLTEFEDLHIHIEALKAIERELMDPDVADKDIRRCTLLIVRKALRHEGTT